MGSSYSIDFQGLERWLRDNGFKKVLIQAPLGLRVEAIRLAELLSSLRVKAFLSGGSCWGGCDVAYHEARSLGLDAVIHLGHSRFMEKDEIPTYYLECRYSDPTPLLKLSEEIKKKLEGRERVGVGLTVQWLDFLEIFLERLRELGLDPRVGEPEPPIVYKGQILGCIYTPLLRISDGVDCFLVVGSIFHGLGLALQTRKPVYAADPEAQRVELLEGLVEEILRSRYGYIEEFKGAGRVGVIIGAKPGQRRLALASSLMKLIKAEKKADLLVMDEIRGESLQNMPHEAFVNTACPRLSIENQEEIEKPLLLPSEALIALGRLRWEDVIRTPSYMAMEAV